MLCLEDPLQEGAGGTVILKYFIHKYMSPYHYTERNNLSALAFMFD